MKLANEDKLFETGVISIHKNEKREMKDLLSLG